ncbi:hypothetical protein [Nonomuraea wenchangensis]|uniref:hypothetical protein n=1 Tax=Nonomuraea wenchangensis TaxID=568860 RepID=UPI0033C4FE64
MEGDAQKEWKRMKAMTYPYMGEYAESLIAKGEANAIFLILEGRGLAVSDEVRDRILSCHDHDVLDAWVLRAITVETAEALFDRSRAS